MDLDQTNGLPHIVDDGSTDATPAILDRLQKVHPNRITLNLFPENTFLRHTTNKGRSWFSAHPE